MHARLLAHNRTFLENVRARLEQALMRRLKGHCQPETHIATPREESEEEYGRKAGVPLTTAAVESDSRWQIAKEHSTDVAFAGTSRSSRTGLRVLCVRSLVTGEAVYGVPDRTSVSWVTTVPGVGRRSEAVATSCVE